MTRYAALLLLALAIPALSSRPASADEVEIVPPPSRDVTPPGFTPGPEGTGPLIREKVPLPPPDPPRWRRFFLAVATDASRFDVGKRHTIIAGITAPAAGDTCKAPDGTTWACGTEALWTLRRFLHGRAIECYFGTADGDPVTAPCRVGATDLGLWLLGAGWAKPGDKASDDYRKAADAARCAGLGLWRDEPADPSCAKAAGK